MSIPIHPVHVDAKAIAMVPIEEVEPGMFTVDGVVLEVIHDTVGEPLAPVVMLRHRSSSIVAPAGKPVVIFSQVSASTLEFIKRGLDLPPAVHPPLGDLVS